MRRLLAVLAAACVAAPTAAAAPRIAHVDASDHPTISVTVVSPSAAAPGLREGGRPAAGLVAENLGRGKSVALAVDRSHSMRGRALDDAVAAARAFVKAKPRADRIGILAVGHQALALTSFSSATIDADLALRGIEIDAEAGTALYDTVVVAARALAAEPFPGRVLILLTDGQEVTSRATLDEAVAAARDADVAVYPVAIESASFRPAPLRRLARETGGTYYSAASTSALTAIYGRIAQELRRTWRLRYVTAARPGESLVLAAGGAEATFRIPGSTPASHPAAGGATLPAAALEGPWGTIAVGLAAGFLVLGALVFAAAARRGSWLRTRLAPHLEHHVPAVRKARAEEAFAAGAALLRATERAFGELAWWRRVHRQLQRADSQLRTVEFLYISAGCALGLGLLVAVTGQSSILVLLALAAGGSAPYARIWWRARRRLKAFENQLPDLLLTLAASLKAGHSFRQGLQTIVDEGQPPASKEFARVLAETRLGRPMEDALNEMAERVNSRNLEFVISAVTIQSQVGGSLAGLFDMVADAVRQRQQFARKIRGLTAMGRAAAYVLVALPFFTAGVLTLVNRTFMEPLWTSGTGHMLIAGGLAMMTMGSLFLKKIVSFRG
ncbi:MAG TPA: type II secretion system F family protein [Gaiellaceae bacterium]|nr:type II secretion system F family protein [Gaiellaceae bacterium]